MVGSVVRMSVGFFGRDHYYWFFCLTWFIIENIWITEKYPPKADERQKSDMGVQTSDVSVQLAAIRSCPGGDQNTSGNCPEKG